MSDSFNYTGMPETAKIRDFIVAHRLKSGDKLYWSKSSLEAIVIENILHKNVTLSPSDHSDQLKTTLMDVELLPHAEDTGIYFEAGLSSND